MSGRSRNSTILERRWLDFDAICVPFISSGGLKVQTGGRLLKWRSPTYLNDGKAGDEWLRSRRLKNPVNVRRADFSMIVFAQRAGVEEITRHSESLFPFGNNHIGH